MKAFLLWLTLGLAVADPADALGQGQCPPGSANCPNPQAPSQAKPIARYWFRSGSGNAPPWSTAVRITAQEAGSKVSQVGSGTVIDGSPKSALVMTCAHVLRGKALQITVEIYGHQMDLTTGSVGAPIARFAAIAVDHDDAHDVGLVRFAPGRELPATRLVGLDWKPSSTLAMCSVGASNGDNPTAVPERFSGVIRYKQMGYDGIECDRLPAQGRSGGGLFDADGLLIGVLDFADPSKRTGIYASTSSLRSILVRNGLIELAGVGPRKSTPLAPNPAQQPPDVARSSPIADAEREAASLITPVLAGAGVGGLGLVAGLIALLKRTRPGSRSAPSSELSLEDLARLLVAGLKERDEREARRKSGEELVERIKALVGEPSTAPESSPKS